MSRLTSTIRTVHRVGVAVWVCLAPAALMSPAWAQSTGPPSLDPELALTQFVHEVWTAEDGLPQNSVSAVAQTRDGYVWIGTQDGLVRFDGVRFRIFAKQDGLGNNEIRALLPRADGSLWIGTYGGGLSRLQNDRVTTFTSADGLPNEHVRSLFEDSQGILWIRHDRGRPRQV